jgi:mannose-6-phosphate isomerase-like protein (cupin superfamily)
VKVRQVVTGHDDAGNAIFLSDDQVQALEVEFMPGFQTFELWSTQENLTVPHQGAFPGVPNYFPGTKGSVFRVITFPPQQGESLTNTSDAALDELDNKLPGLLEHMELDAPGMHTTDSVDYGIVLQGEINLELDNGAERLLSAGSCVVQNGTRHAWHNRSSEPAVMAFILLGATRANTK